MKKDDIRVNRKKIDRVFEIFVLVFFSTVMINSEKWPFGLVVIQEGKKIQQGKKKELDFGFGKRLRKNSG